MIEIKKIGEQGIYQFKIDGKIDEKSAHELYELLKDKADEHETIKMLGVVEEIPSFENFNAFSETMKMKAKALKSIGKYAILSDKHWMEVLLSVGNFVTPSIPLKYFHLGEEDAAIDWLNSDEEA